MTARIAFIGFGEAARAFRATLDGRVEGFSAFDIRDDTEMQQAMAGARVRRTGTATDALTEADWVISAVTADQSAEAARSVAGALRPGQVFFDINSVSPERKRESAELVGRHGAAYIDMAVMAPVHPRGHATPSLIAGPTAGALLAGMAELGFAVEAVGPDVGAATAIKMVRSLFVKGLEAITVETLLAAAASGCFDRILASLSQSYPGLGWPEIATYHFERTLKHGARRAAEMRESAATLEELGLRGRLAAEIAEVQGRMGALDADDPGPGDLKNAVAALAAARRSAG
jgi:3-hydroxyisobutyrate dehydrogenase-like beta-hydroxyacid dehydrogenase